MTYNKTDEELHKQNQASHFRARAKERFKIKVDKQARAAIIKDIERGRAKLLDKSKGARELYLVQVGPHIVQVVFDTVNREVVTMMFTSKIMRNEFKSKGKSSLIMGLHSSLNR